MIKRLPQKEFNKIYSKIPRLCVDIVIHTSDGFLLTKRSTPLSYDGYWHVPGGTVLFHESLVKAVKRIAKRELNLKVAIIKLLGYEEVLYEETIGGAHAVTLGFLVRVVSGKIKINNEASEYGFFKKLPPKLIPEHKKFLQSITEKDLITHT